MHIRIPYQYHQFLSDNEIIELVNNLSDLELIVKNSNVVTMDYDVFVNWIG